MARLLKSDKECVGLTYEVGHKLRELEDAHIKIKGISLVIPGYLQNDYLRFITVKERHRIGDFRHSEAELRSVKEIAVWTVHVNRALRNQPPKLVRWMD